MLLMLHFMLRFVLCSSSLIYSRSQQHGTENRMQGMVGFEVRFYDVTQIVPKPAVKKSMTLKILMFGVKSEISLFLAAYLHGT